MTRRALAIIVPSVVVLAAAGYSVFWWVAATRVVDGVDRWAEQRRAEGWTISYAPVRASGFPRWITLDVRKPEIEAPVTDGVAAWKGTALRTRMRPWRFRQVDFTALGEHEARHLHLPSRQVVVSRATGGRGTVFVGGHDRPHQANVSMTAIAMTLPQATQDVYIGSLVATAKLPFRPSENSSATLDSILADVRLPAALKTPLGNVVQRVDVAATLEGPLREGPLPAVLASWRDAGGNLKIRNLSVRWGPLDVKGRGGLVLDQDLQPAGRMTVRAQGFNETIEALTRDGHIRRKDANVARLVLNLFARPAANGGRPQVTVPLSIKDRVLIAGPQRLTRLPRIIWK